MFTLRKIAPFFIALLLLTHSTACAPSNPPYLSPGDVEVIHSGTSIWVMKEFLRGAPGSFAMQHPETLVTWFGAPMHQGDSYGTVAINLKNAEPIRAWLSCGSGSGTLFQCKDLQEMVKTAQNSGWRFIKPSDLPAEFPQWVSTATSILYRAVVTFDILVVPIGAFNLDDFLPSVDEPKT